MPDRRTRFALPPHVGWPALVVALLMMSIGVSIAAVVAAHSDGGAEPVDGYYAKAAAYDRLAEAQHTSDALGWTLNTETKEGPAVSLRTAILVVRDRAGVPVEGLTGTITVTRPQHSAPLARVPFAPGGPGRYTAPFPFDGPGLYTFSLDAGRGRDRFLATVRVTVR